MWIVQLWLRKMLLKVTPTVSSAHLCWLNQIPTSNGCMISCPPPSRIELGPWAIGTQTETLSCKPFQINAHSYLSCRQITAQPSARSLRHACSSNMETQKISETRAPSSLTWTIRLCGSAWHPLTIPSRPLIMAHGSGSSSLNMMTFTICQSETPMDSRLPTPGLNLPDTTSDVMLKVSTSLPNP